MLKTEAMLEVNKVIRGNVIEVLKTFPKESIDCIITSPPYYGKRDYGSEAVTIWDGDPNCNHEWGEEITERVDYTGFERNRKGLNKMAEALDGNPRYATSQIPPIEMKSSFCKKCGAWRGQLGLEPSPSLYVQHLLQVTAELKRVLKKTGTFFLNIGDTYSRVSENGMKPKSLLLIPERLLIGLYEQGWHVRNRILWVKPNSMPESVKDRLANRYEYVFFLTKSRRYYFDLDAIRVPHKSQDAIPSYYQADELSLAKRFRRRDTPFQVMPSEVPHRGKEKLTKHDIAVERVGNYSYADPLHAKPYHPLGKNPGDIFYDSDVEVQVPKEWGVNKNGEYHGKALKSYENTGAQNPSETKRRIIESFKKHPHLGKNPGDVLYEDESVTTSKYFTTSVQKTASPGGRALLTVASGKLTTKVKKKLFDVGSYLKKQLKESGFSVEDLARLTGVKETTLAHYFRTDLSGQAIPDRLTWDLLRPLLHLGNYDDFVSEEIRSALPQPHPLGKNPGDILEITTEPFGREFCPNCKRFLKRSEVKMVNGSLVCGYCGSPLVSHFAVFPRKLVTPLILAGCPPGGVVLDPFCGSGTALVVAKELGRKYIGIDIVKAYCDMAEVRLKETKVIRKLLS
jgi:DNA modification methylase